MSYINLHQEKAQAAAIPGLLALIKENAEYLFTRNDLKVVTFKIKPKSHSEYTSSASIRVCACLTSTHDPNIRVASRYTRTEYDALLGLQWMLEETVAKEMIIQGVPVLADYEIMDSKSYDKLM